MQMLYVCLSICPSALYSEALKLQENSPQEPPKEPPNEEPQRRTSKKNLKEEPSKDPQRTFFRSQSTSYACSSHIYAFF